MFLSSDTSSPWKAAFSLSESWIIGAVFRTHTNIKYGFFSEIFNDFYLLTTFSKSSIIDIWKGLYYSPRFWTVASQIKLIQ